MSLNKKFIITILELALIPLLLTGFVGYSNIKKQLINNTLEKINVISLIEKYNIQDIISTDLRVLSLFIIDLQRHYSEDGALVWGSISQKKLIKEFANIKNGVDFIQEVFIADPAGIIIASSNFKSMGKNVANEEFFKLGMVKNDASVIQKSSFAGGISHYLVGPIIVNNKIAGVMAIAEYPDFIFSLISDYAGLGNTGEIFLVKNDGRGNALFLSPLRFNSAAPLSLRVQKEKTDSMAVHAVNKEEAVFENTVDYRNVPVFAATRYMNGLNWGIVAKIDQSEALAPLHQLARLFLFIFLASTLVVFIVGTSVSSSITNPIKRLTLLTEKIMEGDLFSSIQISSGSEIGRLAQAFNKMSGKLRESYQNLDKKILERTRNLELKTKELEKLNKFMVGREIKMIELKKKVAELEEKLERKDEPHT